MCPQNTGHAKSLRFSITAYNLKIAGISKLQSTVIKQSKTFVVLCFACITLITSVVYYQPFAYLARVRQKHEAYDTLREGLRQRVGLPPSEYGIGYFTRADLKLAVPHEYIYHKPNRPNGKTNALHLSFFLPNMKPRYVMEQVCSHIMNQWDALICLDQLRLDVFVSPKNEYITYRKGRCLDPELVLFQSNLDNFEISKNEVESLPSLKNGQYDVSLGLIAYKSSKNSFTSSKAVDVDTLYLKQNTDPSNPKEWIHCKAYDCHLCWFRDGLCIEAHCTRELLPNHTQIREKIDQTLDTFIQHTT